MANNAIRLLAATREMERHQKALAATRAARIKQQREKELFEIKKKKANLELEEMKLDNSRTALETKAMESMLSEFMNQQKKVLEGKNAMIDQAEHKAKQGAEQSKRMVKGLLLGDAIQAGGQGMFSPPQALQAPQAPRGVNAIPTVRAVGQMDIGDTGLGLEILNTLPIVGVNKNAGQARQLGTAPENAKFFSLSGEEASPTGEDIVVPEDITEIEELRTFLRSKGMSAEEIQAWERENL